jgi:hypothetical protein
MFHHEKTLRCSLHFGFNGATGGFISGFSAGPSYAGWFTLANNKTNPNANADFSTDHLPHNFANANPHTNEC